MNVTSLDLLPEPLKKVRGQSVRRLGELLAGMFDNADDALFDLADKAANNADQTMYFDSMREVRIKREAMENAFSEALENSFNNCHRKATSQSTDIAQSELNEDSLSLVQDDELEESVAIRGMVSKTNSLFSVQLQQLTQRMDSLLNNTALTNESNPLGAQSLCEAFQHACQELEVNIRARLVVFKLFEKFVLTELAQVYDGANQFLIESGVLPNIESASANTNQRRIPTSKANEEYHAQQTGAGEHDQDDEVFSLLRGLLAKSQQNGYQQGPLPVADSGPVLSQTELVQLLSTVQHGNQMAENVVNFEPQHLDVRQALHNLVEKDGSSAQAVGRVDDDSINLVTMLFEFILDDHNLPVPMKALLARLQIPMLKVALLDKTFFSRAAHPARKLLNELASAALSWNEPTDLARDALYNKIKTVVETVLDDFEDDVDLFPGLLDDFTGFVGKERRKAELIEQRTRDAEEGLGKTQKARAEVGQVINERGAGKTLPKVTVQLLREWANYLFLLHVREGVESDTWNAGVQVVDDLIWSVSGDKSIKHRSALLKMIPSLLQRLREGLNAISFSKTQMRDVFVELEAVHMECLKSQDAEPEGDPVHSQAQQQKASSEPVETGQTMPAVATVPEVIVDTPELEPLDVAESATGNEISDELSSVVDSLAVGAWVEFHSDDGEKNRCKLAAIVRSSGKYIFVNRVGIKVAEYTRSGLIEAAQKRVITVLDNALLFDRALESVIGHLREMKD